MAKQDIPGGQKPRPLSIRLNPELARDSHNLFLMSVQGTSMIQAGIQNGDYVLLKKHYEWIDGAVMLIGIEKNGRAQSQIHRIKFINDSWYGCWEDGSDKQDLLNENYFPQGVYIDTV
jgi:hypothetical protein